MVPSTPRLAGKVAIVTGAGSSGPGIGNGRAAATLFAREGAKILLADLSLPRAQETLAMIEAEGGAATAIAADVTQAADCARMVEACLDHYGRLDILDNNVGISRRGTVVEVTEQAWDETMAVNVKSIVLASKYAIPRMLESGGGAIINISSIAGLRAHSSTPYTASKAAVIGLTISMAADHGPQGIRTNCIAPGLVYTPMVAPRMDDDLRAVRNRAAPLGTEGTAWDIANAALFLASDEARWINGVILPVDAGLVATTPGNLPNPRPANPPLTPAARSTPHCLYRHSGLRRNLSPALPRHPAVQPVIPAFIPSFRRKPESHLRRIRAAVQTTWSVRTFYPPSRRQPESALRGAPVHRPNHPKGNDTRAIPRMTKEGTDG